MWKQLETKILDYMTENNIDYKNDSLYLCDDELSLYICDDKLTFMFEDSKSILHTGIIDIKTLEMKILR